MASDMLLPMTTFPDATPDAVLGPIAGFAAAVLGPLTGLVLEVDIPPLVNPLATPVVDVQAMAEEAEQRSRQKGRHLVEALKQQCKEAGVPCLTRSIAAAPALIGERAAQAARLHDITIVPLDGASPEKRALAEAVIFGSGRPVVVFPETYAGPAGIARIAVGWDNSRAAARAVLDAMPLLEHATSVVVLTVSDDKALAGSAEQELRAYFDRHDVASTHVEVSRGERSVGETLQGEALAHRAGLLVMGAYGHSRMREFVLGGTTRSVLMAPQMPILLSH